MDTVPARLMWVKQDFDRIAIDGVLGDPAGRPGIAYLRVSSAGQAEEGRSGFPRQLLHVHEKARELHIAISWELVFFDDHTGFEFRDRPALTRLRSLVRKQPRPANDLVIENLDRLSREATWHQGFLLDELEKECKVKVHFWKELGSKIERVVYGTIAQDRMLTDLERMANGNIIKAKDKRVTARTPAYGYGLVNSTGGEENAKKDTHYGIYEPEARIVRLIYTWLVAERATLGEISRRLTDMGVKPPKKSQVWDLSLLRAIITNTVYKGEFYAHRYEHVKITSKQTGREVSRKIERPRDQWILVPVPALVSPEVWELAHKTMRDNRTLSKRNSKREFLLVGLTYCADCKTVKMSCGGRIHHKQTRQGMHHYDKAWYRCVTRMRPKHILDQMGRSCTMPEITSWRLDELVWNAVVEVLFDHKRLDDGIERYFSRQKVETTREEMAYVQSQITEVELEDERLYQAYIAQAFDADEFSQKRHALKQKKAKLETEKEELQRRLSQQTQQQEKKRAILASADELRERAGKQIPFDLKRKIVLTVVDKVTVNTREEWFELEGAISGRFDFTHADTDSSRPPA